jgi:hypothetical protein
MNGSSISRDEIAALKKALPSEFARITGTIRLRDGKPEIEIVSADQIKVLDSQTER